MQAKGLRWELLGQHMLLLPQKAMFWEEEKALIVSDLHIGKAGHFRKAGIAIPRPLEQEDLAVLSDLVRALTPQKIIFLGDLFHSELNNEWQWLLLWRELFPDIAMILVKGNHDILNDDLYLKAGFSLYEELQAGPFLFTHEPVKKILHDNNRFVVSGHIHPAVRLRGKGRQSVILPCFYFGSSQAILPAFGAFTGRCCIRVEQGAAVFGVLKERVQRLSS